jgi:hypothetical protein
MGDTYGLRLWPSARINAAGRLMTWALNATFDATMCARADELARRTSTVTRRQTGMRNKQ